MPTGGNGSEGGKGFLSSLVSPALIVRGAAALTEVEVDLIGDLSELFVGMRFALAYCPVARWVGANGVQRSIAGHCLSLAHLCGRDETSNAEER